ncbi:GIY-YIG nuclease family protein [Myxosarcina sp. GI1]|uniref:GIY-YIG nuclease family protein n=1 Tax=Myxosarcina sp. GI1 TaxID=1541065 RepID=UPI0005608363|nr:GIY-YIG nuclease family protein [Myxosarcina sp. GI1]
MSIADSAILQLPKVDLSLRQLLPEYSGIYYVIDENNHVWYIGQAANINKRWQGKTHHRIYQLEARKQQKFTIYYERVDRSQLDTVEKQRIEKYSPHLNTSPVKTKKVRPTETLLRETLVAIADFAFILGVEPPRKEIESQINNNWMAHKQVLELNTIHICINTEALDTKFKIDSIEQREAIFKSIFGSRKAYVNRWQSYSPYCPFTYRLFVNNYAVEVVRLDLWKTAEKTEIAKDYFLTKLAQESIATLTPESLAQFQQQLQNKSWYSLLVGRLIPYTSDLIKLVFNEPIDREAIYKKLATISNDYITRKRGVGSRPEMPDIDKLLINRGIDLQKYSRSGIITMSRQGRIGLFIQCFGFEAQKYRKSASGKLVSSYLAVYETLENHKQKVAPSNLFDTVYLLASVDRQAWLLVEEYLQDFAKPATKLNNGEGYVEKAYVSPRKFLTPAKVKIELQEMKYSAWIPFGLNPKFDTFEAAKEEIKRRLQTANLPNLKLALKKESITK